ncbi:ATP-dependent DNA helicase RecG [Terriglobus aquaticus]|uniref:Probable DNA 3'-5' helicase RecG n=1 Tax=Terriglobus aquaticus TaxID=940139 RepID=A0ABW9KHJ4_9BACT|nr:ATP-dependent DNA helicase RecG [Terriglobus aquaticus]
MIALGTPVQQLKGVGPRNGEALARRGVHTVEDLLYHLPFRYEDRLHPKPLSELVAGETASIIAEVRGSALLYTRRQPIFELTVGHGLQSLTASWFGGVYLKDRFKLGDMVALYGRAEPSRSQGGRFKMIQPQFEVLPAASGDSDPLERLLEVGRIVPVYESLGGTTQSGARLTSRWARRLLWQVLEALAQGPPIPEVLPSAMLQRLGLPGRLQALRETHFPPEGTPMQELQEFRTAAQQRLVFEELFYLELGLELKRKRLRERDGTAFQTGELVRDALKQVLPFRPTAAQKRVLREIVDDMRKPTPMRRLLQGDVGSGKTIVALQAALIAIENGSQAVLMAPTEILATQHYLSAKKLLAKGARRYQVTLLTGALDDASKRSARARILRGEAELIIGTQALIQEKVDFANLGLVIVDEQHRFGVRQRFTLMKKPGGNEPDVLVMTATPIPRTLAMTIYGDLDVSVIDELPPGRTPVVTRRVGQQKASEVWEFVRKQVQRGRQAYVVYPLVEGPSEDQPQLDFAAEAAPIDTKSAAKKSAAKKGARRGAAAKQAALAGMDARAPLRSAVEMYDDLRHGAFADLRVGLLHGRMAADEKEATMGRFQRGEIDILIATTVIEVGVDVPNATVMVIEHAERFGLAQMHQLRGRVGRGAAKSYCVLMTGERVSEEAEQRLDAMVRSQNGFELAELDLQQRGPGEFFGTRQAGMPDLRVASLLRDRRMLEIAKAEAQDLAAGRLHDMTDAEREMVRTQLKEQWQRRYGLVEA